MGRKRSQTVPEIPEFEVLRKIGGGAYGEVWLARSVTGAFRAVKIVWREDFEDVRSFEQEFNGILKYEPISRDHPSLVNILHVGRSTTAPEFYYYVMELGDDITRGNDINPIEYEARTLRTDMRRGVRQPLDTKFCLNVGAQLASALSYLHSCGLAHRDIKPSNIIFVNEKPKLADIGLVAVRDQRSFVGTQGFVPPEGPGTAQADVYSLGKVLYEMATGKDRMDFPELPEELPGGKKRKQWLALNELICGLCEPRRERRSITKAADLVGALERLKQGKPWRQHRLGRKLVLTLIALLLATAASRYTTGHLSDVKIVRNLLETEAPAPLYPPAYLKITSTPDGADVIEVRQNRNVAELIGRTPTDVLEAVVGEEISLRILKDGYRQEAVQLRVPPQAASEPLVVSASLIAFSPPEKNVPWVDQFGSIYGPVGNAHEGYEAIGPRQWKIYAQEENRPPEAATAIRDEDSGSLSIACTHQEAEQFAKWFVNDAIKKGYLSENDEAVPISVKLEQDSANAATEGKSMFRLLVRKIPYARLLVSVSPENAEVLINGISQGQANGETLIDHLRPGKIELETTLEGYKSAKKSIHLKPHETKREEFKLNINKSVVIGKEWKNSLGMKFTPIESDWMASIWETRRKDFREYTIATGERMPPLFGQTTDREENSGENLPIAGLSREECEQFCRWLTHKERQEERLTHGLEYRLPSDWEWSYMAGVQETKNSSPAQRDQGKSQKFYWGDEWPPPNQSGNFADEQSGLPLDTQIIEYTDSYPGLAPVASFTANSYGLFDLEGNVQEWVSDDYSTPTPTPFGGQETLPSYGVLRGGSWRSYQEKDLYIGARNPQPPTARDSSYGFRIILAKVTTPDEQEEEDYWGDDYSPMDP